MPTIPYVKQTWNDGSGGGTPVSAARLNVVENGINEVSQAPAVRVFHNASQNVLTATVTALAFNTGRFNRAGGVASTMHDNVTNNSRLTAVYAGVYLIAGHFSIAANATGQRQAQIRLNGSSVIAINEAPATGGGQNSIIAVSTLWDMAVNDYVELCAFQDSGLTLAVASASFYSPEFGMVRIA